MEFGADLLRPDGQLAFQGVAHEYQGVDFALQDVICGGCGVGDDIDILRPNDDDDLLAGSQTVRQHAVQFAARRHHCAYAGHAGHGAINLALKKISQADEIGDKLFSRRLVDFYGRALLNDPALIHDRHGIGHGQRFQLIVGDVKSRDAQPLDQFAKLEAGFLAQLCIQVAERLVEQQDTRFFDDRARQGETLLLPAAQERRRAIGSSPRVGRASKRGRLYRVFAGANTYVSSRAGESHVFENIQVRPNRVGLKHHADVAIIGRHEGSLGGGIDQIVADKNFVLASRRFQPGDRAQRRGFAAPARAEQGEKLPLVNVDIDTTHRMHPAALGLIKDVEIFNANHTDGGWIHVAPESDIANQQS